MKNKSNALAVATAIAKVNQMAGQTHGVDKPQSVEVRAVNFLKQTKYGPYVEDGDRNGWGSGHATVTIYMESKGTPGDCEVPFDYYDEGFDHALAASQLLDGHIEFVNAAVAVFYKN